MLLLQADAKGWGFLWERYGLAVAILVVVGLAIWKWLIPLINKLLEDARSTTEKQRTDFLTALDAVVSRHLQADLRLADSLDKIREEMRRSKG